MQSQHLASTIFVLLSLANIVSAAAASVTPVQKVLEMMEEMVAKGQTAMEEEAKVFKEYSEWVDDETFKFESEIKTEKAEIDDLVAFIEESSNTIEGLAADIEELEAEIATLEADKKAATAIREKEKAEYLVVSADYKESLAAIAQAIQVLEAQPKSTAQAMMLLQRMAVTVPGMRRVLGAFLQERSEVQRGAPAVAAYENQSGGIIEMLEGLQSKFQEELDSVNTEEANKAHAYDLSVLSMTDTIAHMNADLEEKQTAKAKLTAEVGAAEEQLANTKAELAEDEKMLAEIQSTYAAKTEAFKANQKTRAAEIEAIKKAIEIISSPDVAGSYAKNDLGLVQVASKSLLQMSSASRRSGLKEEAATYLLAQAKVLSSRSLTAMAEQIAANPFAKVVTMIKDLLKKLKEEAAAEAEHKAWCDEELKKNKLKRDKLTSEQKTLVAEIEVLAAKIATMGEKIKALIEGQAELTQAMAEATKQRGKEKADNEATLADCAAAIPAVQKSLTVLKEFYASQSLLQKKAAQVPEMKAYKGQGAASGGVVGMIEVILSDFTRLQADTTADEKQAAMEYDKFMEEAEADKKAKHKEEFETKLAKDQAEFDEKQAAMEYDKFM